MADDNTEKKRLEDIIDGLLRHIRIVEGDLKYHVSQRDHDQKEIERLNKEIDRLNRELTNTQSRLSSF